MFNPDYKTLCIELDVHWIYAYYIQNVRFIRFLTYVLDLNIAGVTFISVYHQDLTFLSKQYFIKDSDTCNNNTYLFLLP